MADKQPLTPTRASRRLRKEEPEIDIAQATQQISTPQRSPRQSPRRSAAKPSARKSARTLVFDDPEVVTEGKAQDKRKSSGGTAEPSPKKRRSKSTGNAEAIQIQTPRDRVNQTPKRNEVSSPAKAILKQLTPQKSTPLHSVTKPPQPEAKSPRKHDKAEETPEKSMLFGKSRKSPRRSSTASVADESDIVEVDMVDSNSKNDENHPDDIDLLIKRASEQISDDEEDEGVVIFTDSFYDEAPRQEKVKLTKKEKRTQRKAEYKRAKKQREKAKKEVAEQRGEEKESPKVEKRGRSTSATEVTEGGDGPVVETPNKVENDDEKESQASTPKKPQKERKRRSTSAAEEVAEEQAVVDVPDTSKTPIQTTPKTQRKGILKARESTGRGGRSIRFDEDEESKAGKLPTTPHPQRALPKSRYPRSAVDDEFFSLAEMNEQLDNQEKGNASGASENILDSFADDDDDSDDETDYRYEDFYEEKSSKPLAKRLAALEESDDESDGDEAILREFGKRALKDAAGDKVGDDEEDSEEEDGPTAGKFKIDKSPFRHLFAQQDTEFEEPMEIDTTVRSLGKKIREEKENEDGESLDDEDEFEAEDNEFGEDELEVEDEYENEAEDMEDDAEEEAEVEDISTNAEEDLTSFQKQQKNLRKTIEQLEEENLAPRSWELAGEVAGADREQDGLLHQYIEVDYKAQPAPVVDEDVNRRIEAIVIQRIKDKAFDDPIRTKRVDHSLTTYRAKTLDDIERKSLMEMYEDEYKKKEAENKKDSDEGEEEVLDAASTEIKNKLSTLFATLDSLSHVQFIPPVVDDEPKLVVNKPAILVEEVGQGASTAADEELLAPEEIAKHVKAEPQSKEERSKTDKLRERRNKKKKQRVLVRKGIKKQGEYKAAAALEAANKEKKHKKVKQADFYQKIQEVNAKEAALKTTKAQKKKQTAQLKAEGKNAAYYKL